MTDRLIRLHEVLHLTGLGRSVLFELQQKGTFPHSIHIADTRAVAWSEAQVQQWIAKQVEQVPAPTPAPSGWTNTWVTKREAGR
jgi:prophage regulatory protein